MSLLRDDLMAAEPATNYPVGGLHEELLASLVAEVLGLPRIAPEDDFLALGGSSLPARRQVVTRLAARLHQVLGLEVPVAVLLVHPTVAGLATWIGASQLGAAVLAVERAASRHEFPLSYGQQRLWFLAQLEPGAATYNMPFALELAGELDSAALEASLRAIERRHETLRTRFGARAGQPFQWIAPAAGTTLPVIDLSSLPRERRERFAARLAEEDCRRPFDLEAGPLWRSRLLRLDAQQHWLVLTLHHTICDGWSIEVLLYELGAHYEALAAGDAAPVLPALPIQYGDYALWQRRYFDRGALTGLLESWKRRLADHLSVLELAVDRTPPATRGAAGASTSIELPARLVEAVKACCRRQRATPFMALLAVFEVLLSRYTGCRQFLVGTPVAQRTRTEIRGLIGFFANTLTLPATIAPEDSFRELLTHVREVAIAAIRHQDLPLEMLVQELAPDRDLLRLSLFQTMFTYHHAPTVVPDLPGLSSRLVEVECGVARFDLTLAAVETERGLRVLLEYSTELLSRAAARRLLGHFASLLEGVAAHPEQRIEALPLLTRAERHQLLMACSDTATDPPRGPLVHELVAAWARRQPEGLAVAAPGERLSYGELVGRAGRLARLLCRLGVGPEVRVALCAGQTVHRVVGSLAVLAAGGAYIPLDPEAPPERLAFLIADSGAAVLLTERSLAGRFYACTARLVELEESGEREGESFPARAVDPDNLAYVVYTSGSTGLPKGVAVSHAGLINLVRWHVAQYRLGPADRATLIANPAFDASVWEIWPYLAAGASVHIPDEETRLSAPAIARFWRREEITWSFLPTPLAEEIMAQGIAHEAVALKGLLCGGDRLHAPPRPDLPFPLFNHYGPSEVSVVSTFAAVPPQSTGVPPIGRPIHNLQTCVVDSSGALVPGGVAGELWVGGVGLARGYLAGPALTAERFLPDPWSGEAGERLYRTGDLVRRRSDGSLEFLGRIDRQIKLRGFRIEPGEIEAALREHPAVSEAAVALLAASPRAGDGGPREHRRLVAYVVGVDGNAPSSQELQELLRQRLPSYMVPPLYVTLSALPLTPNGKLDRKALPQPGRVVGAEERTAPRTPVEQLLADIFTEVLGIEQVGVEEDFFALGGHSLVAAQVAARSQARGLRITVRDLFEAPTIAALARRIAAALRGGEEPAAPPLRRLPRSGDLPLSSAQERLWFLDQLDPGSAAYNIPAAVRLSGFLDLPALAAALAEIGARHEALRTRFESRGGRPVQVLSPEPRLFLGLVDLAGLPRNLRADEIERLAAEEALRPFDLARGNLLRTVVVREDDRLHVALFTMHHIVSDGWSMGVLVRELGSLYRSMLEGTLPTLPELPIQYADFAAWQREHLAERMEQGLSYWRGALAGVPPLALPTDRPRPREIGSNGGGHTFRLPAELSGRLADLARQEGVTPFMILLAGLIAQLSRYTGQEDVAIGSPVANRTRPETEDLIGFFVNTLVLRASCAGDPPHRELLGRVRDVCLNAFAHQDVPFDRVVEALAPERDPGHTPLFQVVFAIQPASWRALELAGLEWTSLPLEERTAKFDLTVTLTEGPAGMAGRWGYHRDLFEAATAARMAGHFEVLLSALAANPAGRLSELPLLREAEREQVLVEWSGRSSPYPREQTLDELFAAIAIRCPEATALTWGDTQMSYGELDRWSGLLARRLAALGIGPDVPVGVLLQRSPELIVATIGILKAGGAYLPLDPSYPPERLGLMLRDAGAPVVVTDEGGAPALPRDEGLTVLLVNRGGGASAEVARQRPQPENLAYVMYTSGSTGAPKGIAVTHRAVSRLVLGNDYARFGPGEVFLHLAPYAFDAATFEIWGALLHGSRLVLAPPEVPTPEELEALLARQGVTTLWLTAGLFHQVVELRPRALRPLRQLLAGGDVLFPEHVRRALAESPGLQLIDGYGPTESTTFACCHPMGDALAVGSTVPLGRPIANTRVYVLDRAGQPTPVGIPGELFLGGDGLARGYLARPELTAERFVPSPYGAPGERLYRTGDLVRWRRSGELDFLGRLDAQVKIRGYRVEPGEVETVLARHEDVGTAAVVVREDAPGDRRLAAYVAPRQGVELDAGDLRAFLQGRLPAHLIPASLSVMAALPLTDRGKVDRRTLASLPAAPPCHSSAARDQTVELLCEAWAEVLGLERVGDDDDFFELGGHSLLATRLVSRIRQLFGVDLPLRALFDTPTPAGLAVRVSAELRQGGGGPLPPLQRQPRDGDLPLSFAQERLWLLSELAPGSTFYNLPVAVRLRGELDAPALGRAFGEIERRHESLRTTFAARGGRPVQIVAPPRASILAQVDLSALGSRREPEALRLAAEEAARPFDLGRDRMLRAALLRLGTDDHVALVTLHHIAADAWSVDVFCRELNALYGSFTAGLEPALAELPIQYGDFALWQRSWLRGERLDALLGYWTERLAGAARLQLPVDRVPPGRSAHRGRSTASKLSRELSESLQGLSRRHGVTPYMLLLSALAVLLSRYGGQDDVSVGSPIANRTRSEVEGLIGFFVNLLVLRCEVSGRAPFGDLLSRVREISLEAYAHQDLPFERLVEELAPERAGSQSSFVAATFSVQNAAALNLELTGMAARPLDVELTTARFDLAVEAWERPDGMELHWIYSTEIFDGSTIERMAGHFATLLSGLSAGCERPVSELPLWEESELRELLAWGEGRVDLPRPAWAHEAFAGWAARSPERPALELGGQRWTYGELEAWVNRLASYLMRQGVGPEQVVGLCVERSPEMVVGVLGILKSGAAYLPLDPENPIDRLCSLVADAGAGWVLTHSDLAERFAAAPAQLVLFDGDAARIAAEPALAPQVEVTAESLAYVLYTSGSTGRPKGVAVSHGSLASFLCWAAEELLAVSARRLPVVTRLSFDANLLQWLAPLARGETVWLVAAEELRDVAALSRLLVGGPEVGFNCVPSLWSAVLAEIEQGRTQVDFGHLYLGGEGFSRELVARTLSILPTVTIWNLYGPTEATSNATCSRVDAAGPIALGRPISGTRVYLLDAELRPVPRGAVGEICIGGVGLARGYRGRPELTAESFVPDAWSGIAGERLFRTGDLGRYCGEGGLEFLGRRDHQVKIRGLRIEPGEIEASLRRHPAVREAVVVLHGQSAGDRYLAAYVVLASEMVAKLAAEGAGERVAAWQESFDDIYDQAVWMEGPEAAYAGWTDRYTGRPFATADMEEWVEVTVARIAELRPQRVLEIGCGTGLLLFRLAPGCAVYRASDLSRNALLFVRERLAQLASPLPQVALHQGAADDFASCGPERFDTIILNSVVQYFPAVDYLLAVLEGAVRRVSPGGAVFVGDVRSLPLLETLHVSLQLHRAGEDLPLEELRQRVRSEVEQDEELALHPAFFHALRSHLPEITAVEIRPRRGRRWTEMAAFRYDVVLHVGSVSEPEPVAAARDWRRDGLSLAALRRLLATESPSALAFTGVPNARLRRAAAALALLRSKGPANTTAGELRRAIDRRLAEEDPGPWVDPEELSAALSDLPYDLDLTWEGGDQTGTFGMLLTRHGTVPLRWPPPPGDGRPWDAYANQPLRGRIVRRLLPQIRASLRESLPEYMVPSAFTLLDALPLNANGKVDRRALPAPATRESGGGYVAPRTPTEKALAEIWEDLLDLERVGIYDNFFDIGGHSLLVTQVVSRVREQFLVDLPLAAVFETATIAELAVALVQLQAEQMDPEALAAMLAEVGSAADQEAGKVPGRTGPGEGELV